MKSQLFKLSQAVDFGEEKGFAIQFSSINHCPFPRAAADSSHVHSVLQKQNRSWFFSPQSNIGEEIKMKGPSH